MYYILVIASEIFSEITLQMEGLIFSKLLFCMEFVTSNSNSNSD